MLENSILNEEIIKKLLKEHYDIDTQNITKINKGSANIYNIDNMYILKEFSSDREVSAIEKEYKIIKHLDKKGNDK